MSCTTLPKIPIPPICITIPTICLTNPPKSHEHPRPRIADLPHSYDYCYELSWHIPAQVPCVPPPGFWASFLLWILIWSPFKFPPADLMTTSPEFTDSPWSYHSSYHLHWHIRPLIPCLSPVNSLIPDIVLPIPMICLQAHPWNIICTILPRFADSPKS